MSQGTDSSSTQDLFKRNNDLRSGEVNYNTMQRPSKKNVFSFLFLSHKKLGLSCTFASGFLSNKK